MKHSLTSAALEDNSTLSTRIIERFPLTVKITIKSSQISENFGAKLRKHDYTLDKEGFAFLKVTPAEPVSAMT